MSSAVSRKLVDRSVAYPNGSPAAGARVVLCGSMAFLPNMNHIGHVLGAYQVKAVLPDPVDSELNYVSQESYNRFKREVSLSHMRKIQHRLTGAILVANFDKHGIRSYIGPNTFAEIAIAFFSGKSIFMLNGIPEQYADELVAWGAKDIGGDIDALVGDLGRQCIEPTDQLTLPEF